MQIKPWIAIDGSTNIATAITRMSCDARGVHTMGLPLSAAMDQGQGPATVAGGGESRGVETGPLVGGQGHHSGGAVGLRGTSGQGEHARKNLKKKKIQFTKPGEL